MSKKIATLIVKLIVSPTPSVIVNFGCQTMTMKAEDNYNIHWKMLRAAGLWQWNLRWRWRAPFDFSRWMHTSNAGALIHQTVHNCLALNSAPKLLSDWRRPTSPPTSGINCLQFFNNEVSHAVATVANNVSESHSIYKPQTTTLFSLNFMTGSHERKLPWLFVGVYCLDGLPTYPFPLVTATWHAR